MPASDSLSIFTSSSITPCILRFSISTRLVCGFPSRRRSRFSKNLLRVAAAQSSSASTVSEENQQQTDPFIESDENPSSKFFGDIIGTLFRLLKTLTRVTPTPFQLLDRDLVLWFDNSSSEWVAFDDKCPHRLAPLSEGRLDENGHLQCSYHRWSFDGCGLCIRIPQASSECQEARAKSPKACATRFPTMVSQGLLFVWPDENGWKKARNTEPPRLPDDLDKPELM